jgi:predicted RND superfamily exporter protein
MQQTFASFVRIVLDRKWVVLSIIVAVTIAAAVILPQAIVASSISEMFFGEGHAGYAQYRERERQFGSDEVLAVAVESDDPLGAENLARLDALHEQVEAMDDIARVTSIANLERVGRDGDTIAVRSFADKAKETPSQRAAFADEIRGDPAIGGLLLSEDSGNFLVLVELTVVDDRAAERGPEIIAEVHEAFDQQGFVAEELHSGGMLVVLSSIVEQSLLNVTKMFPIVVLLLLLAVFLMFGRFWPVFVNSISALLAVAWAMAFSVAQDPELNIFMTLVPVLVLVISFSDVVHLCSAYLLELEDCDSKREAIVAATADVGAACFLTSLTTGVGFLSMTFVPSPVFSQLGVVAAFGVFTAYLLAMTLVPILLELFPTPEPWREGKSGVIQNALGDLLDGAARTSTTHPKKIVFVFAVMIGLAAWGTTQIYFESDFEKRLAPDSQLRQDARFLDEHFVSTTAIDLYVETGEKEGVLDPELFNELAKLEQELEALPEVEKVVSVVDLLRAAHRSFAPEGANFSPLSGPAIAQLFVLLEMQGEDALSPLIDFSRQQTRLTVYTTESGIRSQNFLSHKIADMATARLSSVKGTAEIQDERVEIDATSLPALLGSWVDDVISGQQDGLSFSLVVIALILILGFRSFRVGLWSMVPNILPLLALGGWIGWFWEAADTDTLIVGMIALGIGVDDTIHFISRFRLESLRARDGRTDDVEEAIRNTFRFSGRGIFITTFIFTLGFSPMAMSDYMPIRIMGTMLPFCFVVALVADLFLVPAMIKLGLIRFES